MLENTLSVTDEIVGKPPSRRTVVSAQVKATTSLCFIVKSVGRKTPDDPQEMWGWWDFATNPVRLYEMSACSGSIPARKCRPLRLGEENSQEKLRRRLLFCQWRVNEKRGLILNPYETSKVPSRHFSHVVFTHRVLEETFLPYRRSYFKKLFCKPFHFLSSLYIN